MAQPGNVVDITAGKLQEAVQTKVAGHVLLAQVLVPLLRQAPSSSFTLITGLLGEEGPSGGQHTLNYVKVQGHCRVCVPACLPRRAHPCRRSVPFPRRGVDLRVQRRRVWAGQGVAV
jgi:NAD(P)-dependent dehydrogenase (short-subunit alcohol dehydrogenase family)